MSAPRGSALGGVCSSGGGCLLLGGVWSWGVSGPGGCVCSGGGVVSHHALRQTPPVNRMTNRCKNITLATTSLRPVKTIVGIAPQTSVPKLLL